MPREVTAIDALRELLMGSQQSATSDAAKAEIVKELMGAQNLNRVTEVDNQELVLVSIIKGINSKAKSTVAEEFVKQFLELKVSTDRKGRGEVVDIARPHLIDPTTQRPGWKFW